MESTTMNSAPALPKHRLLGWVGRALAVTLLGLLLVGLYGWWVIARFDTQNLPPRHGQVDTQLFAVEGESRPLIVGLGGAEGGNAWASRRWKQQRDRFIAQGYAVLAVGYFGLPNTPRYLDRIAIDGVHETIARAAQDARVNSHCIAVIGGSRGAELALLLASTYNNIDTVIALAPGSAVFPSLTDAMITPGFSLNGKPLPFVPMPWRATPELLTGDLRGAFEKMMEDHDAMRDAAIAVERIQGPLLLVSATRDEMWPSREMANMLMQRLQTHAFSHVAEHTAMPGGHTAVLDAFPQIEAFLQANFAPDGSACNIQDHARLAVDY